MARRECRNEGASRRLQADVTSIASKYACSASNHYGKVEMVVSFAETQVWGMRGGVLGGGRIWKCD